MPKPSNTTGDRDSGKRLYVGNGPYQVQMRKRTIASMDRIRRQKHSEAKKPYLPDQDYPTMEYQFDPWNPTFPPHEPPPWGPNDPEDPPVDGPPTIGSDPRGRDPTDNKFLGCEAFGGFSPNPVGPGELAFAHFSLGPDEAGIKAVEVDGPVDLVTSMSYLLTLTGRGQQALGKRGGFDIVVRAWDAGRIAADPHYNNVSGGTLFFQVQVKTASYGTAYWLSALPGETPRPNPNWNVGVCIAKGYVEKCPGQILFEFDWELSAQTIAGTGPATVYVKGGVAPYSWSISGTGFSIVGTPTGTSASIQKELGTCGSADIQVEDACGEVVNGEIRSTAGSWQGMEVGEQCILPGGVADFVSNYGNMCWWECIQGKYKQTEKTEVSASWTSECGTFVGCSGGTNPCDEVCATGLYCHDDFGCIDCLTPVGSPNIGITLYWVTNRCDIAYETCDGASRYRECYCIALLGAYEWKC